MQHQCSHPFGVHLISLKSGPTWEAMALARAHRGAIRTLPCRMLAWEPQALSCKSADSNRSPRDGCKACKDGRGHTSTQHPTRPASQLLNIFGHVPSRLTVCIWTGVLLYGTGKPVNQSRRSRGHVVLQIQKLLVWDNPGLPDKSGALLKQGQLPSSHMGSTLS